MFLHCPFGIFFPHLKIHTWMQCVLIQSPCFFDSSVFTLYLEATVRSHFLLLTERLVMKFLHLWALSEAQPSPSSFDLVFTVCVSVHFLSPAPSVYSECLQTARYCLTFVSVLLSSPSPLSSGPCLWWQVSGSGVSHSHNIFFGGVSGVVYSSALECGELHGFVHLFY